MELPEGITASLVTTLPDGRIRLNGHTYQLAEDQMPVQDAALEENAQPAPAEEQERVAPKYDKENMTFNPDVVLYAVENVHLFSSALSLSERREGYLLKAVLGVLYPAHF